MGTIKFFSLIAIASWLHCVSGQTPHECPPERKGLPRLPNSPKRTPSFMGNSSDLQIVGGEEVTANEFPFMVSLQQEVLFQYYHICGGSIYNERFIITAAHCVSGILPFKLSIVAGEHNLFSLSGDEQVSNIRAVNIHPSYDSSTSDNDIAILELTTPLTLNDKVASITMATSATSAGTPVTVAGWGTLESGGNSPDIMNKVTVNVISNTDCNTAYSAIGYSVTNNMICAGVTEGGKDSCQGDSGGPLFQARTRSAQSRAENGQEEKTFWPFTALFPSTAPAPAPAPTPSTVSAYEQIGIVSWGVGCADSRFPGVYARVSEYASYIFSITGSS